MMVSARANKNACWPLDGKGAGPLGGCCKERGARADEVHALVIKGDKVLAVGTFPVQHLSPWKRCDAKRCGWRCSRAARASVCVCEALQGCRNAANAIPADVSVRR